LLPFTKSFDHERDSGREKPNSFRKPDIPPEIVTWAFEDQRNAASAPLA
jgi:hypothetical protein